jgi:hypothetical protein
MNIKSYTTRKWLNKLSSPSTGSICCYYGPSAWDASKTDMFLEVADCHNSARLHKTELESKDDFVEKLKLLRSELDNYIKYLEE